MQVSWERHPWGCEGSKTTQSEELDCDTVTASASATTWEPWSRWSCRWSHVGQGCKLAPKSGVTLREEVPFSQEHAQGRGAHLGAVSCRDSPWLGDGSCPRAARRCPLWCAQDETDAQLPSYCRSHLSPASCSSVLLPSCCWALLLCLSLPHHPISLHWL